MTCSTRIRQRIPRRHRSDRIDDPGGVCLGNGGPRTCRAPDPVRLPPNGGCAAHPASGRGESERGFAARRHRPARCREVVSRSDHRRRANQSVLVQGDAFFSFLASGAIEPWLPAPNDQNTVVTKAAASAAGAFATGGFTTVYDGVVGPWFLATFGAATGLGASTTRFFCRPSRSAFSVWQHDQTMASPMRQRPGRCTPSSIVPAWTFATCCATRRAMRPPSLSSSSRLARPVN